MTNADSRNTDTRDPKAHTHAESDITNLATDLGNKVVVAGQIGGTPASPTVTGITTTDPVTLTLGAVADAQYLKRVGNTLVGAVPTATLPDLIVGKLAPADDTTIAAGYYGMSSQEYEIVDTKFLEIADTAIMEIT